MRGGVAVNQWGADDNAARCVPSALMRAIPSDCMRDRLDESVLETKWIRKGRRTEIRSPVEKLSR